MTTNLLSATRSGSISVTGIIFTLGVAYACGAVARRKGRSHVLWLLAGLVFNVIALASIIVLPRRHARAEGDTPDPDRGRSATASPLELRHTRTVAFPTRHGASGRADGHGAADEIEAWLESQWQRGVD